MHVPVASSAYEGLLNAGKGKCWQDITTTVATSTDKPEDSGGDPGQGTTIAISVSVSVTVSFTVNIAVNLVWEKLKNRRSRKDNGKEGPCKTKIANNKVHPSGDGNVGDGGGGVEITFEAT